LPLAQTAPPAQPFQRLDGCAYKPQRWNDGDSFHVILPDKKEVIFRLYFVDTPEEERVYADRIAEQAAYFGVTPDAAIQIGRGDPPRLLAHMSLRFLTDRMLWGVYAVAGNAITAACFVAAGAKVTRCACTMLCSRRKCP
jgi:hypothetical protein